MYCVPGPAAMELGAGLKKKKCRISRPTSDFVRKSSFLIRSIHDSHAYL
jgi:hypothetical protein